VKQAMVEINVNIKKFEPRNRKFNVAFSQSLYNDIKVTAQDLGVSINAMINQILTDFVEKHKKSKKH
jgi:predicted HicB family RNase H-like nuclease